MATKHPSFPLLRTIRSRMRERYIFNFRLRPEALAPKLPVPWLKPQAKDGWSVVSFCILWLERLQLPPIPAIGNFSTISAANRIGVIDESTPKPEPSVYVTDRWADLPIIAKIAPLVILDSIPIIKAAIGHHQGKTNVQMSYRGGDHLFSADVEASTGPFESEVFSSVDDFAKFIKMGVSSYAPSIYTGKLTKVDLEKEDVAYEPLSATIEYNELNQIWPDTDLQFDSAVRARGAKYEWTYRGLWS
jgi:hypothetical protein